MRLTLERRLGAYVAIVCALLALNNFLPYFGLRDDSCQTMFSGLDWTERWNNHAFMPQKPLGDRWRYVHGVRAELHRPPSDARIHYLASWLDREDRRINVDAMRAVIWQICDAGHGIRVSYRDGGREHVAPDACAHEWLSTPAWWIPVRLYETDLPLERR